MENNKNNFINLICNELQIEKPKIEYNPQKMKSPTQLMAIERNGNDVTIYYSDYNHIYDFYFGIAHELRHLHQDKYELYDLSLVDNPFSDIRKYNLQPHELDANAYACYIMNSVFKTKPLFNGLDDDIKKIIYKNSREF